MSILSEFWYGNIYPSEQALKNDREYFTAMREAAEKLDTLLTKLPPEHRQPVDEVVDMYLRVEGLAERDAFLLGFRLATQLLIDGLTRPAVPEA